MTRSALAVVALTCSVAAFLLSTSIKSKAAVHQPPLHMLWAWERPEDLRFINPVHTGVAFLASTIDVREGKTNVRNRHQPLSVAPESYLMAVIRIESDGTLTTSDDGVIRKIKGELAHTLKPGVKAIQFDFDARQSERKWYCKMLSEVRKELPADCFLSMTALASWCLGDDWISLLRPPVDEVVPMFFDMGGDTQSITTAIEAGKTFGHRFKSIGIRNNERSVNAALSTAGDSVLADNPRVYIFTHSSWNPDKALKIVQEVDRWR